MTIDRDRILSEFIDSWTAGRRPDIDEHLERAAEEDRPGLLEDITSFIRWAPTPDYDEPAIAAIRAEPAMASALARHRKPAPNWAQLLAERRRELSLSMSELASRLVESLGLSAKHAPKAERYLEQAERGDLDPSRFRPKLLDALTSTLETSRSQLGGAARRSMSPPAASPAFRAGKQAAEFIRDDLEVMADLAATPSEEDWDEVDDLFRGG